MEEAKWHLMMGISKLFLRNFIITIITLLILTIGVLASMLDTSNKERLKREAEHQMEVLKLKSEIQIIVEQKNEKFENLLKETLVNQIKTQAEFNKWKQLYQKNKK